MIVTGRHLPRRTFLKGLGAAIALPLLDAMTPAFAAAARAKASPLRLAFTYVPNGVTMADWTPAEHRARVRPARASSQPLDAVPRATRSCSSGLAHKNANALGDGPGDHARAAAATSPASTRRRRRAPTSRTASRSTRSRPRTSATETRLPLDRARLRRLAHGRQLRLRLQLRLHQQRVVARARPRRCRPRPTRGWCSSACSAPSTPSSTPTRARAGACLPPQHARPVSRAHAARSSATSARPTGARWTSTSSSIREIERRIELAEQDMRDLPPGLEMPSGVPVLFADYVKLMFDLQVVAFQADLTRVATMMIGREGSLRTYPEIGVPDPHHPLTHHGGKPDWIEKVTQINTLHMELFAYFIRQLKATPRRRRHAARSLDDRLRQRHRRRRPPQPREPAGAARRPAAAAPCAQAATSSIPTTRR